MVAISGQSRADWCQSGRQSLSASLSLWRRTDDSSFERIRKQIESKSKAIIFFKKSCFQIRRKVASNSGQPLVFFVPMSRIGMKNTSGTTSSVAAGGQSRRIAEIPIECIFPPQLLFSHYCPFCEIFFDKIFDLVVHDFVVHKGISNPKICHDCEEVFETEKELSLHLAHHDMSSSDECNDSDADDSDKDLDYCGGKEDNDSEVDITRKSISNKVSSVSATMVSEECLQSQTKKQPNKRVGHLVGQSNSFSYMKSKSDSRESWKTNHTNQTLFTCDAKRCGKTFKGSKSLVEHKKNVHRFEYECQICGYKSQRKLHLIWHKTSHETNRPFKCSFTDCEYSSKKESQRKNHIQRIHLKSSEKHKIKNNQTENSSANIKANVAPVLAHDSGPNRKTLKAKKPNVNCLYNHHQKGHKLPGEGQLPENYNHCTEDMIKNNKNLRTPTKINLKPALKISNQRKYRVSKV